MGKIWGKKIAGGTASRAEVYGLFVVAILLVGGGIGGAVAATNSGLFSSETLPAGPTQTSSGDNSPSPETEKGLSEPETEKGLSEPESSVRSSCPYTEDELTYYNNIRATKQSTVDWQASQVASVKDAISSLNESVEQLLAAPYRPIEVFQWKPDGTPYAWRVDSNEEIAMERQRILDNQTELVRAESSLAQAIADRDQIPGC
ncbi:hypothetical protein GM51_8870 [freshwater metagenome]|uniref:Uncharacterized protein n=1 Tax=freshwater metagenome TaxID=449393 RepID=A0A094Q7V7_9ZZZZ